MKRGDLVTVSAPGNYGKPRPAVIVQSDWLIATESVLVALVTSALVNAPLYRLTIEPNETNGLKAPSQVMIDKIVAIPREKCGKVVGRLNESERIALDHMLAVVVGIAD
ncbi:MAG: type II toxin-antitoxin system PemK/MazF family toxin [Hyphomicrobiales bacterium]|nr:type II toxin-antitoxin system PemK/MazF family toxin [Hyphomicrobiales bacterium]